MISIRNCNSFCKDWQNFFDSNCTKLDLSGKKHLNVGIIYKDFFLLSSVSYAHMQKWSKQQMLNCPKRDSVVRLFKSSWTRFEKVQLDLKKSHQFSKLVQLDFKTGPTRFQNYSNQFSKLVQLNFKTSPIRFKKKVILVFKTSPTRFQNQYNQFSKLVQLDFKTSPTRLLHQFSKLVQLGKTSESLEPN